MDSRKIHTRMIRLIENIGPAKPGEQPDCAGKLELSYEQRVKGRLLTRDDQDREVGMFLQRGRVLRHGDLLKSEQDEIYMVTAQTEQLSQARCDDWETFAKACYHLGNRHVPVDIGDRVLRIQPDAILEQMLVGLGLQVASVDAPFNPESGAYSGGHHHHH